jgi:hypothetical protein
VIDWLWDYEIEDPVYVMNLSAWISHVFLVWLGLVSSFGQQIMIFILFSWLGLCPSFHSGDKNVPLQIPSFLWASRFRLPLHIPRYLTSQTAAPVQRMGQIKIYYSN